MMFFPSHIAKKYIFILVFALATPFIKPHDPLGSLDLKEYYEIFIIVTLYRKYDRKKQRKIRNKLLTSTVYISNINCEVIRAPIA